MEAWDKNENDFARTGARVMRWMGLLVLIGLAGCDMTDRGIARLQVADDLTLGSSLEEVKGHWYFYSSKALQVDQIMSSSSYLVYRGASLDAGVTGFYLFFKYQEPCIGEGRVAVPPEHDGIQGEGTAGTLVQKNGGTLLQPPMGRPCLFLERPESPPVALHRGRHLPSHPSTPLKTEKI